MHNMPPKMLGPQALSMMQYVEVTLDATQFTSRSSEADEADHFVNSLRGLRGTQTPRKSCHVTIDYRWVQGEFSPRGVVSGLKTLKNFELLTLDFRIWFDRHYDERNYAPSDWRLFDFFNRKLEPELGPGKFDTLRGHCCLSFHPMRERSIGDNPV